MKFLKTWIGVAQTALLLIAIVRFSAADEPVRLHQIQVIGTHNSYHIAPRGAVYEAIAETNATLAGSIDYTHRPLPEQFTQLGIRQIELDVFADPEGGRYAEPLALKTVPTAAAPVDPDGLLKQPGLKVLHVQDFDYQTTVLTFVQALTQIKQWLDAHPNASPIMVLVEVKQSSIGPQFTQPIPFDDTEFRRIDAEILSVFPIEQIVTPQRVQADFSTLRDAITSQGWPALDEVRGKVIFALDNGNPIRDQYLGDRDSYRDRLLFVSVDADHPAAAFMKLNDAVGDFDKIQQAVSQNFLVRTRADAGTQEARKNDPTTRDKAFASGAQFVSTDYPEPDRRFSDYQVRFPKGIVARANPVNGQHLSQKRDYDQP